MADRELAMDPTAVAWEQELQPGAMSDRSRGSSDILCAVAGGDLVSFRDCASALPRKATPAAAAPPNIMLRLTASCRKPAQRQIILKVPAFADLRSGLNSEAAKENSRSSLCDERWKPSMRCAKTSMHGRRSQASISVAVHRTDDFCRGGIWRRSHCRLVETTRYRVGTARQRGRLPSTGTGQLTLVSLTSANAIEMTTLQHSSGAFVQAIDKSRCRRERGHAAAR